MKENNFEIKILSLHWIRNIDDQEDRCAHGQVYLKIANYILSDENSGSWTISSTALYLLRTIERNYKKGDFGSQLLPCCGHFLIGDKEDKEVIILGCPRGVDWTITHIGKQVKLESESGQEVIIDIEVYKKMALDFADTIEEFYKTSKPKDIPTDEFDRKGYLKFWNEWRYLRDKWN